MKHKKTVEEDINLFLEDWGPAQLLQFLRSVIPLFELYDVVDEDDWVEKQIGGGKENVRTVRLIRTVYLISRLCEFHTGKMVSTRAKYPELWKRMEKAGMQDG
jgi:hypothetical protein